MMPPHATNISPMDGSVLLSRVIRISGYTLNGIDKMAKITSGGAKVPFVAQIKCTTEGQGDMPGAVQQRCEGTLTLTGPLKAGQLVTLDLLGSKTSWTVSPKGLP